MKQIITLRRLVLLRSFYRRGVRPWFVLAMQTFARKAGNEVSELSAKIARVNMAVLIAALITTSGLVFFWTVIPSSKNSQEVVFGIIAVAGYWMNAGLIVTAALAVIAYTAYKFGEGGSMSIGWGGDVKALQSGEYDIFPDQHVFSLSENESTLIFKDRMMAVIAECKPGQMVLIIAFRQPRGIIWSPEKQTSFARQEPPFQNGDWTEVQRFGKPEDRYLGEDWNTYTEYLKWFCPHYREWISRQKMEDAHDPILAFAQALTLQSSEI